MTDMVQVEVSEWTSLVTEGRKLRETQDGSQWGLGELAASVETTYGEDSLGKFADEIKAGKKTILNYRTVWNCYKDTGLREKYPRLSFSHFKAAVSTESPEYWLKQSENNGWGADFLSKKISNSLPPDAPIEDKAPRVYRCKDCNMWRLEDVPISGQCHGHYAFHNGKVSYS